MHILIEHPGKTQILTQLWFLRSRNRIAAPDLSLFQTLNKTQSVCTHRSSSIHTLHSWNIRCSDHRTQKLNFIHRMYRAGLPSISADLPLVRQFTGLDSSNHWLLAFMCSIGPQTCFLNIMQQNHPNSTLPDPKTDELQTSKVWIYTKTSKMQTVEFHPSNIPS